MSDFALGFRAWTHVIRGHRVSGEVLPDFSGRRRTICETCFKEWDRG